VLLLLLLLLLLLWLAALAATALLLSQAELQQLEHPPHLPLHQQDTCIHCTVSITITQHTAGDDVTLDPMPP
jgi:hypothetical protein